MVDRLGSLGADNGVETIVHHDDDGDRLIIERAQDVQPILDHNKRLFTHNDGYSPSRELRRVASIPLVVVEKWLREDGIDVFNKDHAEAVRRKLNDPAYAHLRTAPGRV